MTKVNSDIIWRPTGDYLQCRVNKFIRFAGLDNWQQLIERSTRDTDWFWKATQEFCGIRWIEPYHQLVDRSPGFAWTKWFLGGKINIVDNCLDYHLESTERAEYPNRPRVGAQHTALLWESEAAEQRTLTYGELNEMTCRVAAALTDLGIEKGDAVGIFMPMVPEVAGILFGCFKIGAIAVPVFSGSGADALQARMKDAGVKVIFTAYSTIRGGKDLFLKRVVDEAANSLPELRHVVVVGQPKPSDVWQAGRDLSWTNFIEKANADLATVPLPNDAPSLYLYTSGTTGKPKGTVQTHAGALCSSTKRLGFNFDVRPSDHFFWYADIAWIAGLMQMIGVTFWGGTMVMYEGLATYPQPDRIWQVIENQKVTTFCMNPARIRLVRSAGDQWADKHAMPDLRLLGSTGSAWDKGTYMWFFEHVGKMRCPVINVSGGTELFGGLVEVLPVMPLKACTLGGPSLGMDVAVVDDNGNKLEVGEGHLVCRKPSPSMTRGFHNAPQRYLDTYFSKFDETWYHGDWTKIDEDGYWFIFGRSDDTITVSGARVNAGQIEAVLVQHDDVIEAAVIGVPHAEKGEGLVCFAVLAKGAHASSQLGEQLLLEIERTLGRALRPERIHFLESLPKTYTAKVMRDAIRRKYLGLPAGDLSQMERLESLDGVPTIGIDPPATVSAQPLATLNVL